MAKDDVREWGQCEERKNRENIDREKRERKRELNRERNRERKREDGKSKIKIE